MKQLFACVLIQLLFTGLIAAQDAQETSGESGEEKVIPTEISEPPYEVGQLISKEGYYFKDDGFGNTMNFRIVENKIRIYFLDEDMLIMEPPYSKGSVRFRGSVSGRAFHGLTRLSGDVGLGAPGFIRPPHIFSGNLSLKLPDAEEFKSFSFRYSPDLTAATTPSTKEEFGSQSGRSSY